MKLLTHVLPIKRHKNLKSEACIEVQQTPRQNDDQYETRRDETIRIWNLILQFVERTRERS